MINANQLRTLVVDDTVMYRKIVSDILNEMPNVEVVGVASNGKIAMSKIALLKPDLLILDIEMPEMDGLEVLANIKRNAMDVGVVMLSSFTYQGGEMTMKALTLGAFDFILKPKTDSMEESRQFIKNAFTPVLKAFEHHREIKNILKGTAQPYLKNKHYEPISSVQRVKSVTQKAKSEIIALGISTGGPNALAQIMPKIPPDIGVPILIVQHMPPIFTQTLANSLNKKCALTVKEAVNGEPVCPNTAFIAPGGKQMKIITNSNTQAAIIKITDDPAENSCKPSVDYLFRSIAHHHKKPATGVIMTGMGSDGTLGLKLMKRNGATIIAQDEKTCVVYGMPKEPIEAGIVDVIAPLDKIAEEICRTVKKR